MTKYILRINGVEKEDFINTLRARDENLKLDPEGNPTTLWITSSLSKLDLLNLEGVEYVDYSH